VLARVLSSNFTTGRRSAEITGRKFHINPVRDSLFLSRAWINLCISFEDFFFNSTSKSISFSNSSKAAEPVSIFTFQCFLKNSK